MHEYLLRKIFQQSKLQVGFTVVELILVFSLAAIITSFSIAAYVGFGESQYLESAKSDVISVLTNAKSSSQAQVIPASCTTGQLEGYEVIFCGGVSCGLTTTYEMYVQCAGNRRKIGNTRRLPQGIFFDDANTTSRTFVFRPLGKGATGGGIITISGKRGQKSITVDSGGNITSN